MSWPKEPRRVRLACLAMAAAVPLTAAAPASSRGMLDQYCLGCHNQKVKTAGVALDAVDLSKVDTHADVLERVLRKVRTGEMPPMGLPRAEPSVVASFVNSLENSLDQAAAANPNPGRPAVHRLNRGEYGNAIRDLLALDINAGSLLPVDDSGYGFDNIGDVLSLSPTLLERYITVGRTISRMAVGDMTIKPLREEFTIPREPGSGRRPRNERVGDDLPFDSRGGLSVRYYFPLDAEYVIKVKIPQNNPNVTNPEPRILEVRRPIKAGLHTVGVAFLRVSSKTELEAPPPGRRAIAPPAPPKANGPPSELDVRIDGARLKRFEISDNGFTPQVGSLL